MGNNKNPLVPEIPPFIEEDKYLAEKTVEDVLKHFGKNLKNARLNYHRFVEKGMKHGRREDLQGGGLIRSSGGDKAGLLGQKKDEREKGDERILGSGDFVSDVLDQANEREDRKRDYKVNLKELVKRVSYDTDMEIQDLLSSKRERKISHARGIVCYLAVVKLGYNLSEVGKVLGISRKSVSRCIRRGQKNFDNDNEIDQYLK